LQPVTALEWPDEEPDEEFELGLTPRQEPKLTDLEATLVRARDTRQARIEWLMAPEAPEMQSLLDLFERLAWHQRAACRGADPHLFPRARQSSPGRGPGLLRRLPGAPGVPHRSPRVRRGALCRRGVGRDDGTESQGPTARRGVTVVQPSLQTDSTARGVTRGTTLQNRTVACGC